MKKQCTERVTAIFLLAALMLFSITLISPSQALAAEQPQFVLVMESEKSFPATVRAFKEEVSKAGWSVLNVNNMAGVLSERGFTLHPILIMDICSGQYSARILGNDDYRPISAFMPCRVSIYRTSDGKVFVSRMNTAPFAAMMPPEVAEVMAASDAEVDAIIANAIR